MTNDDKERLKKKLFRDEGFTVHDIKIYRGRIFIIVTIKYFYESCLMH